MPHSTRALPDCSSNEARILKSAPKIPEKSASILLSVNDKLVQMAICATHDDPHGFVGVLVVASIGIKTRLQTAGLTLVGLPWIDTQLTPSGAPQMLRECTPS